jgi:hypothetical protein
MSPPGLELADIFRLYGAAYRQKYGERMLPSHLQAMRDIERCRTEALGGQVYHCPDCEQVSYSYHSCRNRHCPKCQNEQGQAWLQEQQALLLPVPYFMLTFTLPAGLREIASRHQRLFYDLLFRTSAEATQQLGHDPHFVGGQMGLVGMLHTWTRNMAYHPHVHYLVPGGGLAADGQWRPARYDFLLPVRILSKLCRGKFHDALRKTDLLKEIPPQVWQQDWVVHCKPVGDGRTALKYLAPYVFRVAISNRRLVKLTDTGDMSTSQVTFQYRTSDTGQLKLCTLSAEAFIHRFLQHVLPKGFVKVRYYGFFGSSVRSRLADLRQQLELAAPPLPPSQKQATKPLPARTPRCPQCGKAMLSLRTVSPTGCRSP